MGVVLEIDLAGLQQAIIDAWSVLQYEVMAG